MKWSIHFPVDQYCIIKLIECSMILLFFCAIVLLTSLKLPKMYDNWFFRIICVIFGHSLRRLVSHFDNVTICYKSDDEKIKRRWNMHLWCKKIMLKCGYKPQPAKKNSQYYNNFRRTQNQYRNRFWPGCLYRYRCIRVGEKRENVRKCSAVVSMNFSFFVSIGICYFRPNVEQFLFKLYRYTVVYYRMYIALLNGLSSSNWNSISIDWEYSILVDRINYPLEG